MPINTSDIKYRLSGGASNSVQNNSLGGARSTVAEMSTNFYDDVSSAEAAAGSVEYRCYYVTNEHPSLTYIASRVFISANTPSATTDIAIGLGTSAINGVEQTVANETTIPVGVTFSSPSNFAAGLLIGDLPPGQHKAVWVRRTINAGTVATNDTATLDVQGDSNP